MDDEDLPDVPEEGVSQEYELSDEGNGDEGNAGGADPPVDAGSEALRKALQNRRAQASDEEQEELTLEEQEELRRLVERLRKAMNPLANMKLPQFGTSSDVLKNFMGATGVYNQIAKSFVPVLQAEQTWRSQFATINSDWIKSMGLLQTQMQPAFLQLTKNVDFGLGSYAKLIEGVGTYQAGWLKNISRTLGALSRSSFYPSNLEGIEGLKWEEVEAVVMLDGISLYGVPRQSITEALIRADGAAKRREILGRRSKGIAQDCRAAIEACETEPVKRYAPTAIAALDAFDAGHTQAAQALAGSLIDGMLRAYFRKDRTKYTPDKKGSRTTEAYEEFTIREFIAFAPMWQAHQQFWVEEGDTVPRTFNRNATAHTVSPRQFTRRNAVQALLFACGLICFFDEGARRLET